ncbi:hypothetical protein TIFTF001_046069 [Ficus carica]|uniref:Uncharacterized protein n=1 Tax=Ficus carica TaxID=3494 RepID=A0AA87ZHP9_FICCA|nr:hypothetical protein TIFTF001_046063 [Ficus carica]GMN26553.1 hypothetical protein TIFTF001_046064 [Ficus carica]GMN26578.1 hypothetical protein TIFTF001_046068 [Ficus carica]GMN26598.1 hypothetical protein TIFTF001_046069 [Ficus carica]
MFSPPVESDVKGSNSLKIHVNAIDLHRHWGCWYAYSKWGAQIWQVKHPGPVVGFDSARARVQVGVGRTQRPRAGSCCCA